MDEDEIEEIFSEDEDDSPSFAWWLRAYWCHLAEWAATSTGKKVDVKSRLRELVFALLVLIIVSTGTLSSLVPDEIKDLILGDARSAFRMGFFILCILIVILAALFMFRFMIVEPVIVYKRQTEEFIKLKNKERLAEAEGITFEARSGVNNQGLVWVGISVSNNMENSALENPIFRLESIDHLNNFHNAIELPKKARPINGSLIRETLLSPGGTPCLYNLAHYEHIEKPAVIRSIHKETFILSAGVYHLKTRLNGSFRNEPFDIINPKDIHWILTVGNNNDLDLRKADENAN